MNRRCPVCFNESREALHTLWFRLLDGVNLPDSYEICICPKCDMVFADTPATQADYDRFYRYHNIYETGASVSDLAKYAMTMEVIPKFTHIHSRILDVGFANGELLKMLRDRGYVDLHGLDPSSKCVDSLRDEGLDAQEGSLLDAVVNDKYDFVILSHVLEHIVDLSKAVKVVHSLLNKNGLVYVETPDLRGYELYKEIPFYYFDIEHINHFTSDSLVNLMYLNGFNCVTLKEKRWPIGKGMHYPAIWGVFMPFSLGTTHGTKDIAKAYISNSLERKWPLIESLITSQEPIIIWGAGSFAQRLYMQGGLDRCNIAGVVDDTPCKAHLQFAGCEIMNPSVIKSLDLPQKILILSVYGTEFIRRKAGDMGLRNELVSIC